MIKSAVPVLRGCRGRQPHFRKEERAEQALLELKINSAVHAGRSDSVARVVLFCEKHHRWVIGSPPEEQQG